MAGRCWDGENCPHEDCDGDLQQQDQFNVMCLSCESVWTHVRSETTHSLQTEDFETVASKPVTIADGGTTTLTTEADHGELKRRLATLLGTDPGRYAAGMGTERHKRLTAAEIDRVCEDLGLDFLTDETKQTQRDAVMLKLGRDHRTGAETWDTSDLVAVLETLEDDDGLRADGGTDQSSGGTDRLVLDVVVRENTRSETLSDFESLLREQFGAVYDDVECNVQTDTVPTEGDQ